MRFKMTGNKRDIVAVVVKNSDTNSLTVKQGSPVILKASGTDDGLAIVSATNVALANLGMFFGIALTDIALNAFGEAQVFGYYDSVRVRVASRAASTDVWASFAAGAVGDGLTLLTGTGGAAASVAADQAVANIGSVAYTVDPYIRLGQTYASQTTQASSLSSTIAGGTVLGGASGTAAYNVYKAFIRAL